MIEGLPKGNYPEAFYRISLKAIIRNSSGEVLCVKENGGTWNLPGGGIDHGESPEECLKRELYEEAAIDRPFISSEFVGADSHYLYSRGAWLMWIVYELRFTETPEAIVGVDADEVAYLDPNIFKDSLDMTTQHIYKWCVDTSYTARKY